MDFRVRSRQPGDIAGITSQDHAAACLDDGSDHMGIGQVG